MTIIMLPLREKENCKKKKKHGMQGVAMGIKKNIKDNYNKAGRAKYKTI